jgi:hypothetical protein
MTAPAVTTTRPPAALPIVVLAQALRQLETALAHLPCRHLDQVQPAWLDVDAAAIQAYRAYDPALNGGSDPIATELDAVRAANRVLNAENDRLRAMLPEEG